MSFKNCFRHTGCGISLIYSLRKGHQNAIAIKYWKVFVKFEQKMFFWKSKIQMRFVFWNWSFALYKLPGSRCASFFPITGERHLGCISFECDIKYWCFVGYPFLGCTQLLAMLLKKARCNIWQVLEHSFYQPWILETFWSKYVPKLFFNNKKRTVAKLKILYILQRLKYFM